MSNYNARVPANQQYKLIEECRSSGLTDYQWCREYGIHFALERKNCRQTNEQWYEAERMV